MTDLFMRRDAAISDCGKYRWSLSRSWEAPLAKPWLGWIMLNPSTADAEIDDPTIRRCIGFARDLGYGSIAVRNLFALRATKPQELWVAPDPVGALANQAILEMCSACAVVVAAWGVHGRYLMRDRKVFDLLHDAGHVLHCLGTTKDGHPRHPLYVAGGTPLQPFTLAEVPA